MSAYLSLIRGTRAWALIRGCALINFFCLWDGRLLEVGTNSRLGAYSNKYGTCTFTTTLSGLGLMIFAKSGGGSFNTSFQNDWEG